MQLTTKQAEIVANARFLVTGGAGFIGSHIAEFLLDAGAKKVTVLDNLTTGHFRNIAPFANHPRFKFIKGDICDLNACKAACREIDFIFHEAGINSVPGAVNNAEMIKSVNETGFMNMLEAAREAGVKRFVYASCSPVNSSKSEFEQYAEQVAKSYGVETIGLRYFNVFGKRQDPDSGYAAVIPRIVMQLIKHESPVIGGTDEYSRDFTYVENVVQANMLAVFTSEPKAVNQVYHIAYKERTSLTQLARCLKEYLSEFDKSIATIKIVHAPAQGHVSHSTVHVDKAKKLLGYQPCDSLRNGLLKSAGWYWTYLPQFAEEAAEKSRCIKHTTAGTTISISA